MSECNPSHETPERLLSQRSTLAGYHNSEKEPFSSPLPTSASSSQKQANTIFTPFSAKFLDHTFKNPRQAYLKALVGGCFLIILAVLTVLPIYWGSLWKTPVGKLQGWVVDFDQGVIGQAVVQNLTSASAQSQASKIKWASKSASDFPGGPNELGNVIVEQHAWVAIAILENSSNNLQESYVSPNASYNGTVVNVYASEARNENAYRIFTRPSVQAQLTNITSQFALDMTHSILQNSSINLPALLASSPQTILTPVGFEFVNLRPFNNPVATTVTFVGLIYQLILAFFVVMTSYGAREASGMNKYLTLRSLIELRLVSSFIAYFFVSLFYALVSLAFQLSFTRKFGHAGFVVFWMLNWVGMLSVGLALESLITVFTAKFIPFFMILWIIVNLSVSSFPIEILPSIYRYGYAVPFYNISHGIRCIVFATKNTVAKNFAILIVWAIISCITLPLLQWFVRRRDIREMGMKSNVLENTPT